MKTLYAIFFLSMGSFGLIAQDEVPLENTNCQVLNITFNQLSSENPIFEYFVDDDRDGLVKFHPFDLEEIGGWSTLLSALSSDSDVSFNHYHTKKSNFFEGSYMRYQQYYNGVLVENGGFSVLVEGDEPESIPVPCIGCPPPVHPCKRKYSMISPYIFENIPDGFSEVPLVAVNSIPSFLPSTMSLVESSELVISHNISYDCTYKLVWKVAYEDSVKGDMVAMIDANSGVLFYTTSPHAHKNAPTADYGIQNMPDQVNGNMTELRNGNLAAFDLSSNSFFVPSTLPTSELNRDWNGNDANPELFQLFWMADRVINTFSANLGIDFNNVRVGFNPSYNGARSDGLGVLGVSSDYTFGTTGGESTVEFDVVAHELAHTLIREYIKGLNTAPMSLHEGIADMLGVYMESLLDNGGLDWVIGDNAPAVANAVGRDLENPLWPCFDDTVDEFTSVHDRSVPLGHWFFLCTNGSDDDNINPMNMQAVIQLVLEALPILGGNYDYPDLMKVTMDLAEEKYGACSNEFATILRSWELICVPTNHRMVDPNEPCAELQGTLVTCEESNAISVCVTENSIGDNNSGIWTVNGRNSINFKSLRGMQGSSQYGGECINIYKIPDMPYYPQYITIQYRKSRHNLSLSRRILINDCDGDDLTCEQYYGLGMVIGDNPHELQSKYIQSYTNISFENSQMDYKMIVFDLLGRQVDISAYELNGHYNGQPQIIIITFWDNFGRFVKSEKRYVH